MPAMSMAFEIRGNAPPVRDGDRIAATLVVTDSKSWLEDVTVRARDGAAGMRLPAASRAMPGAVVPDLPLVDQDGAPMTLRQRRRTGPHRHLHLYPVPAAGFLSADGQAPGSRAPARERGRVWAAGWRFSA